MTDYTAGIRFRSDSRDIRKSEKDLKSMERQAGRTEKAASTLGRTIGRAFAGISAGLVFRSIIRNTIEQEKAVAQLNAALKSTGRFSEENSKALQAQAQALQDVTAYGDETIISAQNLLLTFKEIGDQNFNRATRSVLDLATAMGTDLKSAAIQVGKALNDPKTQLTALSRSGITFSESQKQAIYAMQEAGDVAGAQAAILKELESQFGGSAEAARNTFGGALEGVKNALGDLMEADGDSLPGVVAALNELERTLKTKEVQEGFDAITEGAVRLVTVLAQLPGAFGYVKDEIREFFGVIDSDDIPRIEDQIVSLRDNLRDLQELKGGPLGDLRVSDERIRAVQNEIARLEAQVDAFYSKPREFTAPEVPKLDFGAGSTPTPSPIDPKALKAGESAAASLRSTLNQLAAEIGGPSVQAGVALSATLEELAEKEAALQAAGLLTLESQQQLANARELALQQYQAELDEIAQKDYEEGQKAVDALTASFNSLQSSMDPLSGAGIRLADTMLMLQQREQELIATGRLDAEQQQILASARALATQQYEAEAEAIQSQLTPAQELIEQLRLETELIGLSNIEREKRIALQLAGKDATAEEIAAIEQLINQKARLEETERAANELRQSGEAALASFISGSKSASEAFEDFANSVIQQVARLLAEKAIAAIFGGGFGAAPGGDAGGLFGTVLGSIFGPGRALGGPVYPGRIHPVTERGEPEVLTVGQKQYLITGNQGGMVQPVSNTVNQGNTSLVVNLPPEERRRSASALAANLMREAGRAQARNR